MNTCPHSVHSFSAVSNLLIVGPFNSTSGNPLGVDSFISDNAATAFATTCKHKKNEFHISENLKLQYFQ